MSGQDQSSYQSDEERDSVESYNVEDDDEEERQSAGAVTGDALDKLVASSKPESKPNLTTGVGYVDTDREELGAVPMTGKNRHKWKIIQQATFTNWVNDRLSTGTRMVSGPKVKDLQNDFRNGVLLINLLENLSRNKIPKVVRNPSFTAQELANLELAFKFLNDEKVKIVGIGAQNIHKGDSTLIMGLVWTLIQHYQIMRRNANISSRDLMLKWIQSILPHRNITNFGSDWYNGQNLLYLIHEIKPDKIPPVTSLDPKKVFSNCKLAVRTAKTYLNVPAIIDPESLASGAMDELSMMTYLSYFVKPASKSVLRFVRESLPKHKIENLTTNWSSGIVFAALLDSLFPGSFMKWKDLPHNTSKKNFEKVADVARKCCDIEPPVNLEHLSSQNVDELSVMTYVLRILYGTYKIMPERVNVSGPGIVGTGCGRNTFFVVDYVRAGPGEIEVNMQHSNEENMKVMSNEKSQGITKYSYTPKNPGVIKISVCFSGTPVPGSPYVFSIFDTSSIRIINRDKLSTTIDLGEALEVQVDATSATSGTLTARLIYKSHPPILPTITNNGGIYTVSVIPKYIGSPILRFYWNKEEIRTCALQCSVIDIRSYRIFHHSYKSTYLSFDPVEFYVEASENLSMDPLKLSAVSDDIHVPIQIDCAEKNKGLAEFTPTLPGIYTVFVMCLGRNVEGSPFSVAVVDPTKCVLLTKPSKYMALGQPFEFTINTVDAGIGEIEFYSETPSMFTAEINKVEPSQCIITATPVEIGDTMVSIKHTSSDIPGSPFRVTVCDPSNYYLVGELVDAHVCTTGTPVRLQICQQKALGTHPNVKVQGPTARYPVKLTELSGGDFSIEFTPWEMGEHSLEATIGSFHIHNSPFAFYTDRTTTEICSASGKGLHTAYSGIPAQFIIFASKTGLIESQGIEVRIQNMVRNSKCKVRARDNGDGTYNIAYLANHPGSYLIHLRVSSRNIPGSPFKVSVLPGPLASKCKVQGKALTDPESIFKIGEPIELKVNTSKAGTGKLEVSAIGARGVQARVFTAPRDDSGMQDIQIDPPRPGKYRISIKWSGKHIPDSPFLVKIYPGADPSKCKSYGPGLESAVVNQKSTFTIETRDAGSGMLKVSMSGGVKIDVKPISFLDVRTLSAEYCPDKAGDHIIAVKWSDKDISGSPFRIKVLENTSDHSFNMLPNIPEEDESSDSESNDITYITAKPKMESKMPSTFKMDKKGGGYQKQFSTKKQKPHRAGSRKKGKSKKHKK